MRKPFFIKPNVELLLEFVTDDFSCSSELTEVHVIFGDFVTFLDFTKLVDFTLSTGLEYLENV